MYYFIIQKIFKTIKWNYMKKWDILFSIGNLGDLDKPLTPKILSNPDIPKTPKPH